MNIEARSPITAILSREDILPLRLSGQTRGLVPSPKDLATLVTIAGEMLPRAHIVVLGKVVGGAAVEALAPPIRGWFRLEPIDDDTMKMAELESCTIVKGGKGMRCHSFGEEWAGSQVWVTDGDIGVGLPASLQNAYAISTQPHLGWGLEIVAIAPSPFTVAQSRQFYLDVGFYDPDPWRRAFLHRAAAVIGLHGPDTEGALDPTNAERLLSLANDEELAMDGAAGFDALRKRWYAEVVKTARGYVASGHIKLRKGDGGAWIDEHFQPPNHDHGLADGESPEHSLDSELDYWDGE